MDSVASSHLSLLSTPELQKGGLPFWVFYLLLSVILLLIFINFLQKKDLRQRISYVLASPRRRFSRLRLEAQLKKEESKKSDLLKRLGELTAVQWPGLPGIEEISGKARTLEEQNTVLKGEWHRVYKQLESWKKEKEQLLSSREPGEDTKARLSELDDNLKGLEKELSRIQASIVSTDERLEPFYHSIGNVVYRMRLEREDLAFLYFQIDSLENKIRELKEKLAEL